MAVISTDVNNLTVMRDYVPDVRSRVIRRRVDEGPGCTGVIADRQTAIGSDVDAIRIQSIDADAEC
jgi:hypothetical protein